MPLADLMVCPWQDKFFRPLSADARIALAASLAAEGMRAPVNVLPPGNKAGLAGWTILDGMTRRDIRVEQGATVERVCIRWDLVDLDEHALKARFVAFNLGRRHLTPLERARIALAQYAAERRRPAGSLRPSEEREARDRIGKAAGMTGRNLTRYARVLRTPLAVQRAFEDGHLQLVVAEKVADLRPDVQEEVAGRLAALADPYQAGAVVAEYLPARDRHRHQKVADALAAFVRGLEAGLRDLDGRVDGVTHRQARPHAPTLERAARAIGRLLEAAGSDDEATREFR